MYDLQLPQKGFWKTIELKFIDDPVWLDEYVLVALAFQSPYNLWLLDILNYAAMCEDLEKPA